MTGFVEDVTLSDKLNANVKPLSVDAKNRPALTVKVSTDGKPGVAQAEGKDYTYTKAADGRITVKYAHALKGSQTVTVTIPVKPADKVMQQAVGGQTGPDVGDPNTGSLSAGKHGWYSNDGSNTVTFKNPFDGSTGTSTLPKPIVPVSVAHLAYDKNSDTTTGDMSKQNVTAPAGSKQTVAANGYKNTNYTFQGWNTSKDGKGTTYKPSSKLTLSARHHHPVRAVEADPRHRPL